MRWGKGDKNSSSFSQTEKPFDDPFFLLFSWEKMNGKKRGVKFLHTTQGGPRKKKTSRSLEAYGHRIDRLTGLGG